MKKYAYQVIVSAGELVGFSDGVTIYSDVEMDTSDHELFKQLEEVRDLGDELGMEEESVRLSYLEEGTEEYEEELIIGTSWSIESIELITT